MTDNRYKRDFDEELARLEKILSEAPMRIFTNAEKRGYFAPELRRKFGFSQGLLFAALKKRKTFRKELRPFRNSQGDYEKKYFFSLRGL